jgi:hypothetical protein
MNSPRSQLTNPQRRLPDLSLPAFPAGALTPLRGSGRQAPVLVLVHGLGCTECRAYLEDLAVERDSILEWDGCLLVVTPDAPGVAVNPGGAFEPPVLLLSDPSQQLARAISIGAPAVVIADQWGEIHAAEGAGSEHRFPGPAELVEWVRYLAVQCPECEGEAY